MTNRRDFIRLSTTAGIAVALAPTLLSAKSKKMLGIQLYTLRNELPGNVDAVLAKVSAAGYKEVELFGFDKDKGFWGHSVSDLKKLLKKHKLTAPSGHYMLENFLANPQENTGELMDAIAAAKELGHEYITVPYVSGKFRKTKKDLEDTVLKLSLAAEVAKQSGLKLAYHNHDFEFTDVEGTNMYEVLQADIHKNLYFEMDLYWMAKANQDPIKWFERFPGRFVMFHVKDMDKLEPKLNTEVGSGSIDFKKIFEKASLAGVQHYFVEQENFKIDPFESINTSAAALNKLINS